MTAILEFIQMSGSETFTPSDIVAHLQRRGSPRAQATVRSMIASTMCADSPYAKTNAELSRVSKGVYRLSARTQTPATPELGAPVQFSEGHAVGASTTQVTADLEAEAARVPEAKAAGARAGRLREALNARRAGP